jgi:hypothetical protein
VQRSVRQRRFILKEKRLPLSRCIYALPCLVPRQRSDTRAVCAARWQFGAQSATPSTAAQASIAFPEGKTKAVFKTIQKVSESMRVHGDYTLRAAWLRGDV